MAELRTEAQLAQALGHDENTPLEKIFFNNMGGESVQTGAERSAAGSSAAPVNEPEPADETGAGAQDRAAGSSPIL
jgi:hypothetical protein